MQAGDVLRARIETSRNPPLDNRTVTAVLFVAHVAQARLLFFIEFRGKLLEGTARTVGRTVIENKHIRFRPHRRRYFQQDVYKRLGDVIRRDKDEVIGAHQ